MNLFEACCFENCFELLGRILVGILGVDAFAAMKASRFATNPNETVSASGFKMHLDASESLVVTAAMEPIAHVEIGAEEGIHVLQRVHVESTCNTERIVNDRYEVLFAQRPEGKADAGYWESPGGKIEANESL
jgi:hypothetical protein